MTENDGAVAENRLENLRTTFVDLDGVWERAPPMIKPLINKTINEVHRQIEELEAELEAEP